jgi:hypothetical protein
MRLRLSAMHKSFHFRNFSPHTMRTELDQVAMLQISDLFARTASPRIDDQPAILAALGNAFADHLHVKLVFEINGTDQEVEAFSTIRQQQYSGTYE